MHNDSLGCFKTPKGRAAQDQYGNVLDKECIARDVLNLMTSRWSMLILHALQSGPLRFSELHRKVDGISSRMLAHTVNQLANTGLVERTMLSEAPPHVEYELSKLGKGIVVEIEKLFTWIEMNAGKIDMRNMS